MDIIKLDIEYKIGLFVFVFCLFGGGGGFF